MGKQTKKIVLLFLFIVLFGTVFFQVRRFPEVSSEMTKKGKTEGRGVSIEQLLLVDIPALELSFLNEREERFVLTKRNIFTFAPGGDVVRSKILSPKEEGSSSALPPSFTPAGVEFLGTMCSGGRWFAVIGYQDETLILKLGQEFSKFRVEVIGEDYLEIAHLDNGHREKFFLKRQ
jgi:hypothetical protein